jgi:hypothetical protein
MFLNELSTLSVERTTQRVKIFVRHALDDVEREVNAWIEQNSVRICHVTQSQSEKQGKFVFVISVFYEAVG